MIAHSFIDTNILVYAFAETEDQRHNKARELLERLLDKETAAVSVQVLKEFFAVATGKLKKPLSRRDAVELIKDLCHACRVIDDTVPQLKRTLELASEEKFSIWDASIIAAAEAAGCDELYTEDLAHGILVGNMRMTNPFRS